MPRFLIIRSVARPYPADILNLHSSVTILIDQTDKRKDSTSPLIVCTQNFRVTSSATKLYLVVFWARTPTPSTHSLFDLMLSPQDIATENYLKVTFDGNDQGFWDLRSRVVEGCLRVIGVFFVFLSLLSFFNPAFAFLSPYFLSFCLELGSLLVFLKDSGNNSIRLEGPTLRCQMSTQAFALPSMSHAFQLLISFKVLDSVTASVSLPSVC